MSYLSTSVSFLESPSPSIFILFGRDSNWKINLTDILDKRIVAISAMTRRKKPFFLEKKGLFVAYLFYSYLESLCAVS